MPRAKIVLKQRAFGLIELMVVIAILALLIALLLPAIQAARASARMAACRSHLKQIGLAIANYEGTYKCLPRGVEGRFDRALSPAPMYGVSWWAGVLPFLEQDSVVDKLDRVGYNSGFVQLNSQNGEAIDAFAPAFWFCPSSPVERFVFADIFQVATPSYSGISGATNHDGFAESRVSRCCRSEGQISAGGVLIPNATIRVRRITDGLSNTLLVGEQSDLARTDTDQPRRIGSAFVMGWLAGTRALGTPPNYGDWLKPSYNIVTVRYALNEHRYNLPGVYEDIGANNPLLSAHPGIVNLLYCDGSVAATADSLDIQILKSAATRDDGDALTSDN